jgi:dTDP-4-dehydrorhamnose 3,5-epimerase
MKFVPIGETDARLIELKVHGDDRGHFARTWCADLFREAGIDFTPIQGNTSFTKLQGTVRGMHFQRAPKADAKIVRVTQGTIHDVIVDLREDSATRGQQIVTTLSADAPTMLYIPAGFAHGFQTQTDACLVEYMMGVEYVPDLYSGFRYNDPLLTIDWPQEVTSLSVNDTKWPDLGETVPWLLKERV